MTITADNFKILIVDDGYETLGFLSELLSAYNYQVETTTSGFVALEIAANWQPNLILLDLKMPEIDGYKVCERLQSNPQTQTIPVIFISVLNEVEDRIQALKMGAIDYICKPLHPEEILLRVANQLKIQSLQSQLQEKNRELRQEVIAKETLAEKLSASKKELESIFNSAQIGICLTDICGNILKVNPAYCQLYGFSLQELIGQNLSFRIAESTPKQQYNTNTLYHQLDQIESLSPPNYPSIHCEQIHRRRDNSPIYVDSRTQRFTTQSGEQFAVTTVMDISDKKYAMNIRQTRENNLAILVEIQQQLLIFENRKYTYQTIVELLGNTAKASRIYVFENHRDANGCLVTSQQAEWCAPGITPTIHQDNLQNLSYDEFLPRWLELLGRGSIVSGIVADFPASEREVLEPQGILSILVIPIIVKNEFVGFIGFDNCVSTKIWETADIDFLQAVATAISLAYERQDAQKQLQQQLERSLLIREITNKIRAQLDTQKILTTAAKQIGAALGSSRVLIHVYHPLPVPQVPILAEFLAPGYGSVKNVHIPVLGNTHVSKVLSQDGAVVSANVYTEPLLGEAIAICESLQVKSLLAVRTSSKGEANGMICLHQCDRFREWSSEEVELIESIAAQLGIGLAHAKLLEQEQQARVGLDRQNLRLQAEIYERQQAEAALRESAQKLRRHNLELTRLTKHRILSEPDLLTAVREITVAAVENLEVERASVWLSDDSYRYVECFQTYLRSQGKHVKDPRRFLLTNYPVYLQTLESEQFIVTEDPQGDPRLRELIGDYFIPDRITAKISIPVRLSGTMVGIFCVEQIGQPHTWRQEDISFARALADMLSLILEMRSRQQAEQARIASEARLNAFFNGAPVGMCIIDRQLRYVQINDILAQINEFPIDEHLGKTIEEIIPHLSGQIEAVCLQVLQQNQPILNQEVSAASLNQPDILRDFIISYFPIPSEDGQPCGVGIVLVEITARKQAERELQRVSERLQLLLTSSGATLFSCQPTENLEITFVSPNVSEVFNYHPDEILYHPSFWASRIHPEDRDRILRNFSQLFTQGFHNHDYRFLHGDGSYHWVNTQLRLFCDPESSEPLEIVGYSIDISERKNTELALQESQRRYRNLAEASPVVIFHADTQGNWFYTNHRWQELTGQEPATAQGQGWMTAIHPQDRDRIRHQWQQAVNGATACDLEYRIMGNGKTAWVISQVLPEFDENNQHLGFIGTITDITERHQAEIALRESAERERAVTRAITRMRQTLNIETIFAATTEELRQVLNCDRVVVYQFNPDWSGQFVAESVGREWRSLLRTDAEWGGELVGDEKCTLKDMTSNDSPIVDTYLQTTRGGAYAQGKGFLCVPDIYAAGFQTCYIELLEQFQVRAYITVPIFCGEKLWGLLASYQNSGARKWHSGEIAIVVQIGNQLGVALQQVQQSQALQKAVIAADAANRAKSEFLANMSHELRTPLNAILGFTQLMHRDTSLSAEIRENLGIINRAGEHLLNLINDILEMSKIEAGRSQVNITSFDFYRFLENLQKLLADRAAAKNLEFQVEIAKDIPPYIQTDQSKLRQVLLNLIGNAIKFTSKGKVEVCVNWQQTCEIEFTVSDTGPGIEATELDLLFEAFVQTQTGRNSQQGTGLGLAISRKYVELMGGRMWVDSQVGVGSKFSFVIPVSVTDNGECEDQSHQQIRSLAANQTRNKILVVDDAKDSRLFLVRLLTSVGFQVREATNGEEAIAIWQQWYPDLIFMDMRMPIMDGYTATTTIKNRVREDNHPQPIIIALTANAFAEQKQEMLAAGCDDLINKPLNTQILFQKLQTHLQVEYLYDDTNRETDTSINTSQPLTNPLSDIPNLITQMPKSWREQLFHAAASCSDNLILELLTEIPPEQQILTTYLTELALNFQFEKIIELNNL